MLDLIAQAHGPQLAIQVSEQFVLGRIRPRKDHQRMKSPRATASATRSWCR
jgi:AraC family carnitine catabolism transcriptional activator